MSSLDPQPFTADQVWSGTPWIFAISGWGLFVVACLMCADAWRRERTTVPAILCLGGVLTGFIAEPILGMLDHLKWGAGFPGGTFTAFDNVVPLFIPPLYGFYLGTLGYLVWRFLRGAGPLRSVWAVWAALFAIDFVLQVPAVLLKAFQYVGDDQPLAIAGYPVQSSVKNATAYLLVGFLAWLLWPRLHGWTRLLLVFVPLIGYMGGAICTAWPWYVALGTDLSQPLNLLLAAMTFVMCALFVGAMSQIVAEAGTTRRGSAAEEEQGSRQPSP